MKKLQNLVLRPLFAGIILLAPLAMLEARGDRATHSGGGGHEDHRQNDEHRGDSYERGYDHGYDRGYNHGYGNTWGGAGVGVGIDVAPGGIGVYEEPVYQQPVYAPEPGVNIQIGN